MLTTALAREETALDEHFTLLEGVHALEIGNPRMDTGMQYRSLESELDSLPVIDSADKVVRLVDMLIAREMSWHTGPMLIQTVLSCVYVEDILGAFTELANASPPGDAKAYFDEHVKHAGQVDSWAGVLRAYVLGLAKSISLSIALMEPGVAAIYPEEDIVPSSSLSLLEEASIESVTKCLETAAKWARQQKRPDVVSRLEFRAEWLYILKQRVPRKLAHIDKALALLDGTDPFTGDDAELAAAFSNGIQTRANYVSPMRSLESQSVADAYEQFKWIVQSVGQLSKVYELDTSTDLLGFFVMFAARREPRRPIPVIRAFLKSTVAPTQLLGQTFKSWVTKDIKDLAAGAGAMSKLLDTPKPRAKAILEPFLQQAAQCYADLYVIMCQNRPRQRQNLAHTVVAWDSLQVAADDAARALADAGVDLPPYRTPGGDVHVDPLSMWVFIRKVFIMVWVVLMGFELELYKDWEHALMLRAAEGLLETVEQRLYAVGAHLEAERLQRSRSYAYVLSLRHETYMLRALCGAGALVGVALDRLNATRRPSAPATSPELLYALRVKPFSSVGVPELPTYAQFRAYADSFSSAADAASRARKLAKEASTLADAGLRANKDNRELSLLKRSAVATSVAAADLARVSPDDAKRRGTVLQTDNVHWYFPVLSLARSAS